MEIVKEAMVCVECWDYIMGNDDSLEYHEVPKERINEIKQKFEKWMEVTLPDGTVGSGYIVHGDGHDPFSWKSCDVCKSHLGGERFEIILQQ